MEVKKQHLLVDDTDYETEVPEGYMSGRKTEKPGPGEIRAIIPGVIKSIGVKPGQSVKAGDVLIILEAMKMYNDIEAEADGKVAQILVSDGDKVAKGQLMVTIK